MCNAAKDGIFAICPRNLDKMTDKCEVSPSPRLSRSRGVE
jgi:hypothetical protein